jgi:hypothetical protein
MPNLEMEPERELSVFRRLALGTWRTAYDPSVYGSLTLRVDKALAYIDAFRAATGKHLTIRETPVVRDGRVATERTMRVCVTFDHRVLDGVHAAAMPKILRTWIEDPAAHFDPIPARLPRTAQRA